jgi:hypothetical protein
VENKQGGGGVGGWEDSRDQANAVHPPLMTRQRGVFLGGGGLGP